MNINSPTDLTLLAVAVNEKIARLDEQRIALGIERERVGGTVNVGEEVNLAIRTTYALIVRRIEQALDVPFVDQEEANRVARAIERISADFDEEVEFDRESQPEWNGSFR